MLRYHIKTLLIVNVLLTSAILLCRAIYSSISVFIISLLALIVLYDISLCRKFLEQVAKFRYIFITLFLFQLLLRRDGDIYFQYYFLKITEHGVLYSVTSLMRYLVILISATMLGSSSAYEMIKALRTWKLPEPVVIMVSFTIQFLRQLQVDFRILYQNLLRRNISFRGRSLKGKLNLLSLLIIPVIGRLFSDIRYKVIAMELNGYGIKRTASSFFYKKCQPRDYLLMMFFLGILSLIWHIL